MHAENLPEPTREVTLKSSIKFDTACPRTGADACVYEAVHDWGQLPQGLLLGNTHGVCVDAQGYIYVHHTVHKDSHSHDAMVIFDGEGKFVRSWGADFMGGAHGLHLHEESGEEFLYLCDYKRAVVVKTTLSGEEVWTIGYPHQSSAYKLKADGKKIKYRPTNLAIAPNGDIYVSDGYGSSYINRYDSKGEYLQTFGGLGEEAGKLNCPHGIIVDLRDGKEPILMVADRGNRRIQRFSLNGKHLDFIAGTNMPCHFAFAKNGDMVVPDLAARVTLMDRKNNVIAHLGDDSATEWQKTRLLPRDKFTPGKFVAPHSACFDHDGNIFVVEWVEVGRITKLRKV
jgi:hypothetical protein